MMTSENEPKNPEETDPGTEQKTVVRVCGWIWQSAFGMLGILGLACIIILVACLFLDGIIHLPHVPDDVTNWIILGGITCWLIGTLFLILDSIFGGQSSLTRLPLMSLGYFVWVILLGIFSIPLPLALLSCYIIPS